MRINTNKLMKSNWLEEDMNHYWGRRGIPYNSKNSRRTMNRMFKNRWRRYVDKLMRQEIAEYQQLV